MSNLQPLSFSRHGTLGWRPITPPVIVEPDLDTLPVALEELIRLTTRMPVVLGLADGPIEAVIPLGSFDRRAGALVDGAGYWQPAAVPRALRPGPFGPVSSPEGEIAMVHENMLRPLAAEEQGVVPIFESKAALSERTRQEIVEALAWKRGRNDARAAARALEAAGCLREMRLGNLSVRVVDEDRLARIEGAILNRLHRAGALRLAHLSAVSLSTLVVGARAGQKPEAAADASFFLAAMREAME
jgi:hypothetical protein